MGGLDKAAAIVAALDWLRSRLGPEAFVVNDHWETDLCAVGIASPRDPRVLVYITCYGERPERIGYELELPPPPGAEFPYQVAGQGSAVTLEELAEVVAGHLQHAARDDRV